MAICSTPRGVFVGFGRPRGSRSLGWQPAQRLAASSSGSGHDQRIYGRRRQLLNASRRLRRVSGADSINSTTDARACAQRLAASSSGSARPGSTPTAAGTAAQRLAASSSGSGRTRLRPRPRTPRGVVGVLCSTPRGVVVGFGSSATTSSPALATAQRLAASSSGSEPPRKRRQGRPLREASSTTPGLGPARADTEIPFRPSPWPKPRTGRGMRRFTILPPCQMAGSAREAAT